MPTGGGPHATTHPCRDVDACGSWLIGCSNDYVPKAPPATGAPAAKPAPPSSSASSFSPRPSAKQSPERIAAKASAVRSATESPPSTKPVVTDPPTRAPDQYPSAYRWAWRSLDRAPRDIHEFQRRVCSGRERFALGRLCLVIERAHGARNKRSIRLDKEGTLAIRSTAGIRPMAPSRHTLRAAAAAGFRDRSS